MSENLLQTRWLSLTAALGLTPGRTEETYRELIKAYGGPGRYYHNLDHLESVLAAIERLEDVTRHPNLVQLSGWFHDAIYDTRASDNEERSAVLAEAACTSWGLPAELASRVGGLIRATRTHQADEDDVDASVLLDADLCILGAEEAVYDAYARAIRQEYAWVPDSEFRQGRTRVLQGFLQRAQLFRLERMRRQYEERARENLMRELASLAGD